MENIENLILGGASFEEVQGMYPQYRKEEIEKIFDRIAKFCWIDESEGD